MKMKIRALLLFLFIAGAVASHADPLPEIKSFPDLGSCTGNSVRLRSKPDTKSEILGKLNEFDRAIAINQRIINGKKWFQVEHPTASGTAWVYGDYLIPELYAMKPVFKRLLIKLNQDYGVTSEKARVIFGDEIKIKTEKFSRPDVSYTKTFVSHKNFNLEYLNNNLTEVEVMSGDFPFGDIKIGDNAEKVIKILGEPDNRENSVFLYNVDDMTMFSFSIENGVITHMNYMFYYDI